MEGMLEKGRKGIGGEAKVAEGERRRRKEEEEEGEGRRRT